MLDQRLWTMTLLMAGTLAACSMDLKKADDSSSPATPGSSSYPPPVGEQLPSAKDQAPQGGSLQDGKDGKRNVKVYVHYMLAQNLGEQTTAHVEAFDNQYFSGSPAAAAEIPEFHAAAGEWKDVTLSVSPGTYFVRAYLTTGSDPRVPYELAGMQLVADAPVGVYGALGAPKSVQVQTLEQSQTVDPVDINLDQLFKKPGSDPDTNAKLRLDLSVAAGTTVPDHLKVHIHLLTSSDLSKDPAYSFELDSAEFLVQGRLGKAEFVSPSLAEGDYDVFAWIDADGNGFYDKGELAALYLADGAPQKIAVRKDSTQTIALDLVAAPKLPAP